ncbi:hypothetical protein AAC387_Pa11g0701 [Persea americana]
MKKGVDFVSDAECEAAFQDIKSYLTRPTVLVAPTTEKPFILYTRALDYSLGALLAQENDWGKEAALYYLSRMLVGAEHRYSPVEKECLAMMFAVQKLHHYLLSNTVYLISMINLLKVFVTKAGSLNAQLAKWSILLSQFDIRYVPQKAIKGQALVDFLAEHPLPKNSPLKDDLSDERVYNVEASSPNASWNMYFNGATRTNEKGKPISGIGILFVSPDKYMIPHAFSLLEPCSNNAAEYQALIIGLELALKSDALVGLAASMAIQEGEDIQITVCQRRILPPLNTHQAVAECHRVVGSRISILKPAISDWRDPFIDYIMFGILPEDPKERVSIQRRAPNFHLDIPSKMLYKKSFNGVLLRCLSQQEAEETLKEVLAGLSGAHQAGPKLYDQIKRLGYYWPTMVADAM